MAIDLSIITISHHHERFLQDCFTSLVEHASDISYEIILIDNTNSPDLYNDLIHDFPAVRFFSNKTAQGFAANCNKAFSLSSGRYILFLNPDTKIIDGNLGDLLKNADKIPNLGAFSSRLLNTDMTRQNSFRKFPSISAIIFRGLNLYKFLPPIPSYRRYMIDDWRSGSLCEVDWMIGAFLMIKREVFKGINMMDEKFFLYYEDMDLCYRLKRSGYSCYYLPGVDVVHLHLRDSAKKIISKHKYYHIMSCMYFFIKHRYLCSPGV